MSNVNIPAAELRALADDTAASIYETGSEVGGEADAVSYVTRRAMDALVDEIGPRQMDPKSTEVLHTLVSLQISMGQRYHALIEFDEAAKDAENEELRQSFGL